jgi:hypothetical protein
MPHPRMPSPPHALLLAVVTIASTVIATPARAGEPDPTGTPTLAGVWTLDVEKSDSAREKMEAMRSSGGRGMRGGLGGGMGGGPMRGGGGGSRPPRGPDPGSGEGRRHARGPEMRLMVRPPASLLIEQTDSTVVLFEQGLPIEVLVVGLPQDKAGTVEPEATHINASWSGARLLALREDERGGRAAQELALSADRKVLTLTLRREPRDDAPPIEIRRVYRREG